MYLHIFLGCNINLQKTAIMVDRVYWTIKALQVEKLNLRIGNCCLHKFFTTVVYLFSLHNAVIAIWKVSFVALLALENPYYYKYLLCTLVISLTYFWIPYDEPDTTAELVHLLMHLWPLQYVSFEYHHDKELY